MLVENLYILFPMGDDGSRARKMWNDKDKQSKKLDTFSGALLPWELSCALYPVPVDVGPEGKARGEVYSNK